MHAKPDNTYLIPNEPLDRFTPTNLDLLLQFCYERHASDITIQTEEHITAEIYGVLYPTTRRRLTKNEVGTLLNHIYGPNGTTQLASGYDLDTYYEFRPTRIERYRFRVNATACLVEGYEGIQITMRVIPTHPPELKDMLLPQEIMDNIDPDDGAVYITGSTGSGKSTLLAAIIRFIAEQEDSNRKILTYESPIEFVYDDVNKPSCIISQSEIPRHLPSFAAGVRNALRRKPRLILVGETRDQETTNALLEASLTGHPVYTTVHSNGVAETVRRLVNAFSEEERNSKSIDIIETMRMIVWQRLVKTVDGKRMPLREYLVFNEAIRSKLLSVPVDRISQATRKIVKEQDHTMLDDAKRAFKDGKIDKAILTKIERYHQGQDHDMGVGS
ncbi:MAG: Dot/Icm type IV secretion system ATPase DotB [Pseudomonadota bacterium]|nr:Dot/Icm type IV secretion system ATPase DotB [Pseudomonadota bacterium]